MRFERMQPLAYRCALRSRGEISSRSRMHSNFAPPSRARHTYTIHNDTTGPEGGDCMLVGGGCGIETPRGLSRHLLTPTVASPPPIG